MTLFNQAEEARAAHPEEFDYGKKVADIAFSDELTPPLDVVIRKTGHDPNVLSFEDKLNFCLGAFSPLNMLEYSRLLEPADMASMYRVLQIHQNRGQYQR